MGSGLLQVYTHLKSAFSVWESAGSETETVVASWCQKNKEKLKKKQKKKKGRRKRSYSVCHTKDHGIAEHAVQAQAAA
jgi:hypothetical protein